MNVGMMMSLKSNFSIATNGHVFIAVGSGANTISYSIDNGVTWIGLGNSIFSSVAYGICWNGKMFIAGGSGTNTIAYSYNGINWTGLGTSVFSTYAYGICWNGSVFVAVGCGTNTIATSIDGITWTGSLSTITNMGLGICSTSSPNLFPSVYEKK